MLIVAALILASAAVEPACADSFTKVLKGELAVYLDPSERNTKRTTKQVIADVLTPFRKDLRHPRCAVQVGCALANFGTLKLVSRALEAEAGFYDSAQHGPGTNHGVPDPSGALPDVGDLRLASNDLRNCAPNLNVSDEPPKGLADPDPRNWDPVDVARAMEAIRLELAKRRSEGALPTPTPTPPRQPLVRDSHGVLGQPALDTQEVSDQPGDFSYYPFTRLGLARFFALLDPAMVQNERTLDEIDHFPDESDLYLLEWQSLSPAYRQEHQIDSFAQYHAARWKETDDAAPHPDMDAVAAALRSLEAKSN